MNSESPPTWPVVEPPPFLPVPRRRWPLALVVAVVLALAAAGAGYLWLNPGLLVQSAREAADADASANDKAVMTDLLATQQKTADDLAALERAVADQQEQLKAIVGQLANLSSKIDALKSPALQPAVPPFPSAGPVGSTPPVAAPPVTSAPAARVVPRPKKPPRAATPTPTGPISVGGAPLNVAPDTTAR